MSYPEKSFWNFSTGNIFALQKMTPTPVTPKFGVSKNPDVSIYFEYLGEFCSQIHNIPCLFQYRSNFSPK